MRKKIFVILPILLAIVVILLLLTLNNYIHDTANKKLLGESATKPIVDTQITRSDVQIVRQRLQCAENINFDGFRVTQIRTGNSLEGYRSVDSCFAESDFHLGGTGTIIATHELEMSGDCGNVRELTDLRIQTCRLDNNEHVSTLKDFLSLPLTEWYIDLKSTSYTDKPNEVYTAVVRAIDDIEVMGRQAGAALMVYSAPEEVVRLIHEHGIRAGIKGYPKDIQETMDMVDLASDSQFELVCVNLHYIDAGVLDYSKKLGIWILAWDTEGVKNSAIWKEQKEAGLGGLITPRLDYARKFFKCYWYATWYDTKILARKVLLKIWRVVKRQET